MKERTFDVNELIISVLQGRATAQQQEELLRWREASVDNEAGYRSMEELWRQIPPSDKLSGSPAPSFAALRYRARARVAAPRSAPRLLALAVTALLLVLAGSTIAGSLSVNETTASFGPAEVVTGPNDMATTILADGSVVRLAERSRVRSFSEGTNRVVEIDGRAFLSVASDSSRPFIVRTTSGEATVLGTRFEVDARAAAMSVLVVEGSVSVRSAGGGEEVRVQAGERSHHSRDSPPAVEAVEGPQRRLAWLGAFAAFESTPLFEVFDELEQRLGIRFQFEDPSIGERTLTGAFAEDDESAVIDLVCRAAGVRCSNDGDVIRVAP